MFKSYKGFFYSYLYKKKFIRGEILITIKDNQTIVTLKYKGSYRFDKIDEFKFNYYEEEMSSPELNINIKNIYDIYLDGEYFTKIPHDKGYFELVRIY